VKVADEGPGRLADVADGCCGFNRRAARLAKMPENRASAGTQKRILAAAREYQACCYVASKRLEMGWTAGGTGAPALQRLAL